MSQIATPPAATDALHALGATLHRHAAGAGPELLCMATHVGGGVFATVADRALRGSRPGRPYADLRLHLLDGSGRVLPGEWAAECPLRPILFLKARRGEGLPAPEVATMAAAAEREYAEVWRVGHGRGVFHEVDQARGPRAAEGCILRHPLMTRFRNNADPLWDAATIAVPCSFDYPGPVDLGSPVVLGDGRLAGVLVGGDLGPESGHQGAYVPAETILPFARLLEMLADGDRGMSVPTRRTGSGITPTARIRRADSRAACRRSRGRQGQRASGASPSRCHTVSAVEDVGAVGRMQEDVPPVRHVEADMAEGLPEPGERPRFALAFAMPGGARRAGLG